MLKKFCFADFGVIQVLFVTNIQYSFKHYNQAGKENWNFKDDVKFYK